MGIANREQGQLLSWHADISEAPPGSSQKTDVYLLSKIQTSLYRNDRRHGAHKQLSPLGVLSQVSNRM